MQYTVELWYFDQNGKFRYSAEHETDCEWMWEISDELRSLFLQGKRPGLCDGRSNLTVVVNPAGHPNGYPVFLGAVA